MIVGETEMDALYFRVSSERQTTENQFAELLEVAEQDGSGRNWSKIRSLLASAVCEEEVTSRRGLKRIGEATRATRE